MTSSPQGGFTTSWAAFPTYFFAAGGSDTSVWFIALTDQFQHAVYRGESSDGGASFTWTILPFLRDPHDSEYTALAASPTDVLAAGGYGRLRAWDGKQFTQAAIAVKKTPVIDPFYGVWTSGGEVWAVGEGIALHRRRRCSCPNRPGTRPTSA